MNDISIRQHYSDFVRKMMKNQLAIGALVAAAVACAQIYTDYRSNLDETKRIAAELRNGLLSGADVSTVQLCKMAFQAPGIVGVKVETASGELCNLTKSGYFFGYHAHAEIFFAADSKGPLAGRLQIRFSLLNITGLIIVLYLILGLFSLILLRTSSRAMKSVDAILIDPIIWLAEQFGGATELTVVTPYTGKKIPNEINRLIGSFNQMATRTLTSLQAQKDAEIAQNQLLFARQVAHDIRSPLSALNIATTTISDLPEDRRNLIHNAIARINTIANSLLIKSKKQTNGILESQDPDAVIESKRVLLSDVVESLLQEKRLQFSDRSIEIKSDFVDSSEVFIKANLTEFERLLSNLINNSVEALGDQAGQILVSIRNYQNMVQLSVRDNGAGIPQEILRQLGQAGLSFGKEGSQSGSGLGVYHAKNYVESVGGKFNINSQVGQGTVIQMIFPKARLGALNSTNRSL